MWMKAASGDAHGVAACSSDKLDTMSSAEARPSQTLLRHVAEHGATVQRREPGRHRLARSQQILLKEKSKLQYDEYIMYVKNKSHIHVLCRKIQKVTLKYALLEKGRGTRLRIMCKKDFRCICNALKIVKTFDKCTYLITSVLYYFKILKGIYKCQELLSNLEFMYPHTRLFYFVWGLEITRSASPPDFEFNSEFHWPHEISLSTHFLKWGKGRNCDFKGKTNTLPGHDSPMSYTA